jgi:hypothetical protein
MTCSLRIGIDMLCVLPLDRWQSRQWQLYTPSGAAAMR